MEKLTKTTVEIPERLFRKAKARAALEGISLRELFLRGLQLALRSPTETASRQRVTFPLIKTNSNRARLSDEQVYNALDSDADLNQ